jgi:hypothetical protein
MGCIREIRDLGSELWDPAKKVSRIRIQGSIKHRIPDPQGPQHCRNRKEFRREK